MFINKKKKEMDTAVLMIALTNARVLLTKKICTEEEYNEHTKVVIDTITETLQRKGDFNDIVANLSTK